jgi:ribosomal protein S18 acetylase RimI-like enzyme
MSQALITIRRALPGDAEQIAAVHDAAWREAYRGIIPGRELERLIARRGPDWWRAAVLQGSRLLVLSLHGAVGGYVSYGRNRAPSLDFGGEIFELYLAPEYQGLGFGSRLFRAGRRDLADNGLNTMIVWTLSDNQRAIDFYKRLGGEPVRRASEYFGGEKLGRLALGFGPIAH